MAQKFTFITHPDDQDFIDNKLMPLLKGLVQKRLSFTELTLEQAEPVLLFLSDVQIKEIFPRLLENRGPIAILPHKDSPIINANLGLESGLKKTIEHISTLEDPLELDLMYCNGAPVLSYLVLGDTFQLMASKVEGLSELKQKLSRLVNRLFKLKPFALKIHLKNDRTLSSIASGVIVTQHKRSLLLSRLIPGESFVRDGMFHVFILSPRSLLELVFFTVKSLLTKEYFPTFGAHIKSDQLKLSAIGSKPLRFTIDEESYEAPTIIIEMKIKHVLIYPGPDLDLSESSGEASEIYRLSSLPMGDAIEELTGKTLPLIKSASTEEFKELFQVLRENARPKGSYLVLMVLSTILATLGLFANSSSVVIGAMILAPLMPPIITLSMATLRQDKKLILQSGVTIFLGMGVAFASAVTITWLTPISSSNSEILGRVHPTLLDLGVAVVSGIAGAYAHAREEIAKTLAGVAIAVALVPPLAVSAIGFGWLDFSIFSGAALLLITNLAGMVLAGALTFLVLGFSPFRLARKGVLISGVAVLGLCIPLGLSFHKMVSEHTIVKQLNELKLQDVSISEAKVLTFSPLKIGLKLVAPNSLDTKKLDQVKNKVETALKRSATLEMAITISR